MDPTLALNAAHWRKAIAGAAFSASALRKALTEVPLQERDAWLDVAFGIESVPDDGPALPPGCVPYLPSSVDVILRAVELTRLSPADTVVDIGSGAGRAAALLHLLTGASVIGIEVQPQLIAASKELMTRLNISRFFPVQGDASSLARCMNIASTFFMYCPFSGDRLAHILDDLEAIARTRKIRMCCVDVELPARGWFTLEASSGEDLRIYASVLDPQTGKTPAHPGVA